MKKRNKKIRYWDGKPSNTGYQIGIAPSLRGQEYLKPLDMTLQANAVGSTILPNAIGRAVNLAGTANNPFTNYKTLFGATGLKAGQKVTEDQIANIIGKIGEDNFSKLGYDIGSTVTRDQVKNTASAMGAKTGMNSLGYITAAAGALQGGIGLLTDFNNWKGGLTESDLQQASGKSTNVINGRTYNQIGSYDRSGAYKLIDKMNTNDMVSTVGDAAQTGGAVGSLFGPIGWGIGTGLGGFLGFVGSLIGGNSRKKRAEQAMRNWEVTRNGYNTQEESVAASLGVGDEFYNGRYGAVRGKTSNGDMYKKGSRNSHIEIGPIETDEGVKFGPIRSNVSVGESIVNFEKGTAHYIRGKSSRRGKDLEHSDEAPGTPGFIAGFVPNPITGNYIADDAKPHAEKIENNNQLKEYAMNNTKGTTLETLLSQIEKDNNLHFAALKWLEGIQDIMNKQNVKFSKKDILAMGNYKCGKHSYAEGKNVLDEALVVAPRKNYELVGKMPFYMPHLNAVTLPQVPTQEDLQQEIQNQSTPTPREGRSFLSGLAEFAPYAMQSLYPLNELAHYQGTPIRTENSYIPNQYAEDAIRTMKNRSFDIYNPLQALNNQKRLALYNIRKSGLGPAQQMAMLSSLNANNASQIAGLWAQKRNEDNKYAAETAQMAAQIGEQEAARQQQARAAEIQQKIAAQGKKDEGIGKAWKGFSNIAEGFAKHALSAQQMEEMKKLYKAQIRAYDADYEKNRTINEAFKAGTHDIDGRPILQPKIQEQPEPETDADRIKRGEDWANEWLDAAGLGNTVTDPHQLSIRRAILGAGASPEDYAKIFAEDFLKDPRYAKYVDYLSSQTTSDGSNGALLFNPYAGNSTYFSTDAQGRFMPNMSYWNMLAANPATKYLASVPPSFINPPVEAAPVEQKPTTAKKNTTRKRQTRTRRR